MGDCALKLEFAQLFRLCRDPNISVQEVSASGKVLFSFKRSLNDVEIAEWHRLVGLVSQIPQEERRDKMRWALERNGKYTTKYLYRARAMTFVWVCWWVGGGVGEGCKTS